MRIVGFHVSGGEIPRRQKGHEGLRMNTRPATQANSRRRTNSRKGAEIMEFTLVLLPLLAMIMVLMDISWAVFVKATLQGAVRNGVRYGIPSPVPRPTPRVDASPIW